MRIWKATDTKQADLDRLSQPRVNEIKAAIEGGQKVTVHLPHIGIERDENTGELRINFVDGRHRFTAHKALGMELPMLVDTNISGDLNRDPELSAFVKHLPARIKEQLKDENTGAHGSLHEETRETIRKWVRDNEEMLRRQFRVKYGQFVGDKAYAFYAKHGEWAPNHLIETWQEQAKKLGLSIEPDLEAIQAIRKEEMREMYTRLVGAEHAGQCMDIVAATGLPIHRQTVEALRAGITTQAAIELERSIPGIQRGVEVAAAEPGQEQSAKRWVGGAEPKTAADRLAELSTKKADRDATVRQERPTKWLDRGRGDGGGRGI